MTARIVDGVVYSPHPDYDVQNHCAPRVIRGGLSKFGEKVVAIDNVLRLTGNQLLRRIRRYALGFQRSGLGPGSYVCVHLSNTVDTVAAVLGVVFTGATVVMARPTLVPRDLLYIIKDSECRYVLTDKHGASKVLEVRKRHRLEEVFCLGDLHGFTDISPFQELSESSFKEYSPISNTEDVIAVLYTSGSTGLPKGAEASHKAYVSSFEALDSLKLMTEDDVFLSWSPITHVSGFCVNMFAMCIGATTIFRERSLPFKEFVKDLETYKVSILFGLATKMRAIIEEVKAAGASVPQIKKILLAGSPIQKSFSKDMCQVFNIETMANIYALTEAFGPVCGTAPGHVTTDNVGFPVAGCKVKIVDTASGQTMAVFEHGEIWIHCITAMKGYRRRPEDTAAVLTADGWLRTGDVGYLDDVGRLYIVDRLKQMIKCMDNQLAPAELEEILMSHYAVEEVSVIGLPSAKYGEAPAACVVLRDGYKENHKAIEEQLKQLVAGQTAVYKHLYGGVFFMDSLPKSDTCKILRQALKSEVAARQAMESNK
uniref:Putative acyl-coa synthetase n=1 Tax=Ixodes ricinus TaxID=34613 RepID=A0A6B0VFE3_IXORI